MTIPSVVVILMALAIAYIWGSRGFYSALIHMVCCVIAGGVAFAVWEPLSYVFLTRDLPDWIAHSAFAIALALPFGLTLAILRGAVDGTLRANADMDGASNMIGGAFCGAVSGVIATGIMVMSVGMLGGKPDFVGLDPIDDQAGLAVAERSMWVPTDRITAAMYSRLASTTFRPFGAGSGATVGEVYPHMTVQGAMYRDTFNAQGRNLIRPNAFEVQSRYTVGKNSKVENLTADTLDTRRQQVVDLDGETIPPGNAYIEGFSVEFNAGAREKSGRVIVGNTQVQLVVRNQQGETRVLTPMAVISRAEPPIDDDGNSSSEILYGRWRYEAPGTHISSVGGSDSVPMAFEFLIPKQFEAEQLFVKGVRVDLAELEAGVDHESTEARDERILSGKIFDRTISEVDVSNAVRWDPDAPPADATVGKWIRISRDLPARRTLQKDNRGGLEIEADGNVNYIVRGELRLNLPELPDFVRERSLQLRRFQVAEDSAMVQVTVDRRNVEFGFLSSVARSGQGLDRDKAPVLIDSNGTAFKPVGFIFEDSIEFRILYDPQNPIQSLDDDRLPVLTISKPDDELTLLFRVDARTDLKYFAVGSKVLAEMRPELEVRGRGR